MTVTSKDMCLLQPEQIAQNWGDIESRMYADPVFFRTFTKSYVVEKLMKGDMQLWTVGTDLVVLTQAAQGPITKNLQILWAYGSELDKYLELVWEIFHKYAAMVGCQKIELFGREAWARKLRRLPGVELAYIALQCDVKPMRGN